ncbi:hypothetical protein [Steroidobacter cummioxidans]|uniref:hypothetical protein n=1 Tax=Steroidobacter cummioxidans TaxID=1803913 RepID=UPI0012902BCA|nr:hypothetical protein [Steroidobacter cummioxidans]
MEKRDEFTLRSSAVKKWLASLFLIAVCIALIFPPAFWLTAPGVLLIVAAKVANSYRTEQWMSWENEGSLNWFEGWAAATGVILAITPLVLVLIRWVLQ